MGDAAVLFAVFVVAVAALWLGVRRYNARLAASRNWRRKEVPGTQQYSVPGVAKYSVYCQRGRGPSLERQHIGDVPDDDPDFDNKLYELRVAADLRAATLNGD